MHDSEPKLDRRRRSLAKAVGFIVICGVVATLWLTFFPPIGSPSRNSRLMSRSVVRAREVASALLVYAGDYDDRLPNSFYNESSLHAILDWQGITFSNTLNPNGGTFMPNTNLAGVCFAEIEDPLRTVLIYETMPWPHRDRRVYGLADGSGRTVPPDEKLIWGVEP